MSLQGIKVAKEYGNGLPSFEDLEEARQALYKLRDERLAELEELSKTGQTMFHFNLTPDSLKGLEKWYFSLHEADGFGTLSIDRAAFEACMGAYYLGVAIKNAPGTEWLVAEYFLAKGKYELGVKRGLMRMMVSGFTNNHQLPNNKRKEKLFRDYQKYFVNSPYK